MYIYIYAFQIYYIKLLQAKVFQILEYCFQITILENFYFFQNFCKKVAKFIPCKTCFIVKNNL